MTTGFFFSPRECRPNLFKFPSTLVANVPAFRRDGGDGRKHNLIHLFDERRQFRQLRTTQSVRVWLLTPETQPAVWCSAKQTFSENHLAAAPGNVLVVHVCSRMCVCEFARWKTSGKWAPRKALPAANDFKAFYV